MYTNPMTKKHIMLIKEECPWVEVLKPVEKVLVCGDIGMGGMREWTDIVEILVKRLGGANTDDEEDDENDNDNGAFDDEEDEDEEEEEEEDEDQNK
jgi:phosphopantothenoylcysteine decarboxylase